LASYGWAIHDVTYHSEKRPKAALRGTQGGPRICEEASLMLNGINDNAQEDAP
jgi:hypothetical protein